MCAILALPLIQSHLMSSKGHIAHIVDKANYVIWMIK